MTTAEIGAQGVVGPRLPEADSAYKDGQQSALFVGAYQGAVAEAMTHARALRQGVRRTPRASTVGAPVDEDVDVLRQVGVVVFALVGGHHQRAVARRDDGRDAIVFGVVVARTIQGGASQRVGGFARLCHQSEGQEDNPKDHNVPEDGLLGV